MNITITRKLEVDAGHRLMNHEGKCRNYHGHRYVFEVTCTGPELDAVGRVIDFSVIKSVVGKWLDDILDHGMILQLGDPAIELLSTHGKVLVVPWSPTAENIVAWVHVVAADLLKPHNIFVTRVRCYETPNCWADSVALEDPA